MLCSICSKCLRFQSPDSLSALHLCFHKMDKVQVQIPVLPSYVPPLSDEIIVYPSFLLGQILLRPSPPIRHQVLLMKRRVRFPQCCQVRFTGVELYLAQGVILRMPDSIVCLPFTHVSVFQPPAAPDREALTPTCRNSASLQLYLPKSQV